MEKPRNPLTCWSGDSPARTSASPAQGLASPERDPAYGRSTRESFASFDPGSQSWKTSRLYLVAAWGAFSATWPRAGMMRSGTCFLRPPLAPLTCASASSLLPTPAAIEGEPIRQYLRRDETWLSTSNLTAKLIGVAYALKDREPKPPYRLIPALSFVEWMMGVPIGWTDCAVLATASRLLCLPGYSGG